MNAQLLYTNQLYETNSSYFSPCATFIFYPNFSLLGDKILYESIISSFRLNNPNSPVWGIEWSCDKISMMQYPFPPNATFVLPSFTTKNKIYFEKFFKWLDDCNKKYASNLHTYIDHNSNQQFIDQSLSKTIKIKSLWDELVAISKAGRFPKLILPEQASRIMESKLNDYTFNIKEKFVTIHIRCLEKQSDKNLDLQKYVNVGNEIVKRLGMKVVFLGKNDTFSNESRNPAEFKSKWIFDWRDKFETIWETAYLIKNAVAHIGGDSGPTHLAAALGTKIVTVERATKVPEMDYGPFVDSGNIIRLTKENSTIDNIINSLKALLNNSNDHPEHTSGIFKPEAPYSGSASNDGNGFPGYDHCLIPQNNKGKQDELIQLFAGISEQNMDEFSFCLYNQLLEDKIPNSLYVPIQGKYLSDFIPTIKNLPIMGLSVLYPFKQEILSYIEEMDKFSSITGTADTVVNINGRWIAYNFSIPVILELLGNATKFKGKTVLIYGNSTEASALGVELLNMGCDVVTLDQKALLCEKADIFINAAVPYLKNDSISNNFINLIPESVTIVMDFQENSYNTPLKQIADNRSCQYIGWQEIMRKKVIFQVEIFAEARGMSHAR